MFNLVINTGSVKWIVTNGTPRGVANTRALVRDPSGDGGRWGRSDGDAVEVHEESRLKGRATLGSRDERMTEWWKETKEVGG